jgi:hypothetical protein
VAHPMNHARAHHVEKSRVGRLTKGYKSGGAVKEIGKKSLSLHKEEHKAIHAEGDGSKHRMDRPKRAKGGKVKGKSNAKTVVNVITGHPGGGAAPPPMAPPGLAGAMAPPPVAPPPMGVKPPMPGPGMPPPGMPMRKRGGAVKSIGMHVGTKVQHTDGKDDGKDIGRGRVVTFWAGGKVKKDCGGPAQTPTRARGGKVESSDAVAPATKLPGGGGGARARLAKEARAKRDYHGPD